MFRKQKFIIPIILILVLLVGVLIFSLSYYTPENIIFRSMNIELPKSAKIIDFDFKWKYSNFGAKIQLKNDDINYINKLLNDYFKGEATDAVKKSPPTGYYIYDWWDLSNKDIDKSYSSTASFQKKIFGLTPKNRDVYAAITKKINNSYYLYILY